ncbi:MAG: bifunctional glutamate N-acetyltransferase/amino-acid acetyltransferase ArgJ [Actinomycetota bacterium]|nr:bifunctional glutamate N-acetyltransferase/amino-acid acetyltransferase ArgJ [Actinomycetota bacterium]
MATKQSKNGENINNFTIIKDGTITSVPGFYAAACHCGIKSSKKPDICIIYTPEDSICSGVYTKNKFCAAPVQVTKETLKKSKSIKAIVVNSGVANACTGKTGYGNAKKTIDIAAKYLKTDCGSIIVSSTGVIGKQLPMDKIEYGIKECSSKLSSNGGHDAAKAILTTDLQTKEIAVSFNASDDEDIIIGGIAKGSGMIEPDMATLLVFITTNIGISKSLLDEILHEETDKSFNSITIDGCQSTNDMVVVMANARSSVFLKDKNSKYYDDFKNAFSYVMKYLAKKIVMDGEGATKLIKIKVINAKDIADARTLAFKVANSNLFKCAMFGQDLNWGRINAALGSAAGCDFDSDKVKIYFDDILIVENGMGVEFDKVEVKNLMKERELNFTIDLNYGDKSFEVLTADLSFDYIKINALYRT